MYGTIRSAWTLNDGNFNWQIAIPANTTATIYLPANDQSALAESGHSVHNSEGVTFLRMENGFAAYRLESGSYRFSSLFVQQKVNLSE